MADPPLPAACCSRRRSDAEPEPAHARQVNSPNGRRRQWQALHSSAAAVLLALVAVAALLPCVIAGTTYPFYAFELTPNLYQISGFASDPELSGNFYVASRASTNCIYQYSNGGASTCLSGFGLSTSFDANGPGFSQLAYDNVSTVYVPNYANHSLSKFDMATGAITSPWVGTPGNKGSSDGTGLAAQFDNPVAVAISKAGNFLIVADAYGSRLRRVDLTTLAVTTLASSTAANNYMGSRV